MMNNRYYWEQRAELRLLKNLKDIEETEQKLNAIYFRAYKDIALFIDKTFFSFCKRYGLSGEEAIALLNSPVSPDEYNTLLAKIATVKDEKLKKKLYAKLNSNAYGYRISRLQAIREDIYITLNKVAVDELKHGTKALKGAITYAYFDTVFTYQNVMGYEVIQDTTANLVKEILKREWVGGSYSTRVWTNTDKVAKELQKVLGTGLVSGKQYKDMAKEIEHLLIEVGSSGAKRLIRTEAAYVTNQTEFEVYKEEGTKEYQFLATLDRKTSKKCRDNDLEIFKLSEKVDGVNYPPLHPNCRSTTIPIIEGFPLKQRRAKDKNGEYILVDGNMKYSEWYERFVKK